MEHRTCLAFHRGAVELLVMKLLAGNLGIFLKSGMILFGRVIVRQGTAHGMTPFYLMTFHTFLKVLSLRNNGISACFVGGSSDMRTEDKAISGHFPLVFVTPEKVNPKYYIRNTRYLPYTCFRGSTAPRTTWLALIKLLIC